MKEMTEPVMIEEIVEVKKTYWTCGNPLHRHRTQFVALFCIRESTRKKIEQQPVTDKRLLSLLEMHAAGKTLAEMAAVDGGGRSRVNQLLKEAKRRKVEGLL